MRRQGQPTGAVSARPAGPRNRACGNTPLPRAKGYLRPGKLAFTATPRRPRTDSCGPAGAPFHCLRPYGPHSKRCPNWTPGPVWGMPHRHSSLPSREPPAPPPVALPRQRHVNALTASSGWVFRDTPHGHPRPPRAELASPSRASLHPPHSPTPPSALFIPRATRSRGTDEGSGPTPMPAHLTPPPRCRGPANIPRPPCASPPLGPPSRPPPTPRSTRGLQPPHPQAKVDQGTARAPAGLHGLPGLPGPALGHTGASRPPTCTLRTPTAPTPSGRAQPVTPRSRLPCHVLDPRRVAHSPSLRPPAWPRGTPSACPRSRNTRKMLCLATAASAAANVLDLSHDERDGSEFSLILFSFSKECYWRTHHRSEHAGRGCQVRVAARDRDQPATCDTSGCAQAPRPGHPSHGDGSSTPRLPKARPTGRPRRTWPSRLSQVLRVEGKGRGPSTAYRPRHTPPWTHGCQLVIGARRPRQSWAPCGQALATPATTTPPEQCTQRTRIREKRDTVDQGPGLRHRRPAAGPETHTLTPA